MSLFQGFSIALRLALRELRGGARGFAVFIACLALGVMSIAGVGSFARSLSDGLAREGRTILGGDVAFSLIQREATSQEREFLARRGTLSAVATLRAMARGPAEQIALVELKSVDAGYPLYGQVALDGAASLAAATAPRNGAFGAAVDAALLARLDLKPGARMSVGAATLEITAVIQSEPDKLGSGIGFGPRVIVSEAALRATDLLQPGSLVRWTYRLRTSDGSDSTADAIIEQTNAALPDAGWEVRSRNNAAPSLERNVERFSQFLTLVGLTALLVGGVGVANAVKSYLDRRRETIATLKAVGASGGRVFAIYLIQVLILALIGSAIGLALGAALPFLIAGAFGKILPLPIAPALQPAELGLALLYGLLTALAFALWPLGRAHDVPVSALFRDAIEPERRWPRRRYVVGTVLVVSTLAALAVLLAFDRRVAFVFVASAGAVFVALYLVAQGVMALARRAPRAQSTALRLAVANIHRPGALTLTIVLSLGLGLALLVTVVQIDGNLRRQFSAALPERAPSFFFVDLQSADIERFDGFVRARMPGAELERVPMLRGRIVAAKGVRAEDLKVTPNAAWVLQSDRGITYASEPPAGSRVIEGQWWKPGETATLLSLEKRIADGLGVGIGDEMTVNVLGRNITARIANLRTVDWQSLGLNFVLVFSPGAFASAPHTFVATLSHGRDNTLAGETALIKAVADAFPAVTTVRVKDAIDAVGGVVNNLILAIRGASVVALVSAILVLGGALAAGHRHRVYDAVILKTLGATRRRLIGAYALEYLMLGAATAVFGVAAGSLAAWLVVSRVMNLPFTVLPGSALAVAFGALFVTVGFGLIGTFSALGQKPAPVLRNL